MPTQSEKKRLLIMGVIAALLGIVAVISIAMRLMKARQVKANVELVVPQMEQLQRQKMPSQRFLEKQQAQEALLKQPWGRSPFAKAEVKPDPAGSLKVKPVKEEPFVLEGVILRGSGKVALINGDFLREGEMIEGAVVKSIEQERVILEKNNKEIVLELEAG